MDLQYDDTTDQLSLIFTPLPDDTSSSNGKLRRIELPNDDGYMEIVESEDYVDFIQRLSLKRVVTRGSVEAIIYNEQEDVLMILFAKPARADQWSTCHTESGDCEHGLTLRKVDNRVYSLTLACLSHSYDNVRTQVLGDARWQVALATGSRSICDEHRHGKRLRAKPRKIVASVLKSYPKHFEPNCCNYCMLLFFEEELEIRVCMLCEEGISVCSDCEKPAFTVWDGYVCRDCGKEEKKRCAEALELITPAVVTAVTATVATGTI